MTSAGRGYLLVKRLLDLVFITVALPVVLPLGLILALLIRIDSPGPVLFAQERTGQHGRRFRMWKFRTMVANAEELKKDLAHLNVLEPPDFKIPDDPRITRVGRFLRKTSLDELPQLLNLAQGTMTLVGPRPTSFAAHTYDLWHTSRLEVPPGITGLWQITARHTTGFDERLRLDHRYMGEMSLRTDLRILLGTVTTIFGGRGA